MWIMASWANNGHILGCPYFASRTMADTADLIFCPYNYILEPCKDHALVSLR